MILSEFIHPNLQIYKSLFNFNSILQLTQLISKSIYDKMSDILLQRLTTGELKDSGIIEHISDLIREEIQNKSELKGMNHLQIFSYYLRKNKFKVDTLLDQKSLYNKMNEPKKQEPYISNVKKLQKKLNHLQNRKAYIRPNLLQQYYALKTAGISIGQTNAVHLNNIIKTLAIQNDTKTIRFWGKILGLKDYWVIQGSSSKNYLNELGQNSQNYGNGINTYSYWVAIQILGEWHELPLVTPQQVRLSRQLKYIFTGSLQNKISSLKTFNGQEKHLLKCVLARITHSCQIVPKGLYKLNQQNPSVLEFEQQFKSPQVAQLNSVDAWVHLNAHILNQGRATYYIDMKIPQQQRQALQTELSQKDPLIQRLKGISEDKPYEALGYTTNWTVQICGQTIPINLVGKQEGQTAIYGVTLLKNLVWPGACTVGYRGGWTNIYIGYGHRISQPNNLIKELNEIQVQGEQKKQSSQPNPKKAPLIQQKIEGQVEGQQGQVQPSD